jgi:hypothetical protein
LGNNPGTNVLELGDSKGWMKQLKNWLLDDYFFF